MTITLTTAGHRAVEASNGESALEKFHAHAPDLVLLDIALGPHTIDGLEVCRRIRKSSDVPVIFITTHGEDIDQIIGFSTGADDFLTKPINHRLLLARIAAVLRRQEGSRRTTEATRISHAGIDMDLTARTVTVHDQPVDLTRIQFDLLTALAENPTRVMTRQQLVECVWGEWYGNDHHLDVHLSRLRQRIVAAAGPRVAHAVRGVGFRFTS